MLFWACPSINTKWLFFLEEPLYMWMWSSMQSSAAAQKFQITANVVFSSSSSSSQKLVLEENCSLLWHEKEQANAQKGGLDWQSSQVVLEHKIVLFYNFVFFHKAEAAATAHCLRSYLALIFLIYPVSGLAPINFSCWGFLFNTRVPHIVL